MPDGIRLMRHAGFTELEQLTPERRTFVIDVEESSIPFILQYKDVLVERFKASSYGRKEHLSSLIRKACRGLHPSELIYCTSAEADVQ